MATISRPLVEWPGCRDLGQKFEILEIPRHAPFEFEGKKSGLKGQNHNPRGPPCENGK